MNSKHLPARGTVGRIALRRRLTLYSVGAACWATGALWLIFQYFVRVEDEFGFDGVHPLQKAWLILHAVASLWAVWLFGVLYPNHVKKGWKMKARRPTGGALFGLIAWLSLTGIALYYVGSDAARSWTSILHWAAGLAALFVFLVHLLTRALPFDESARRDMTKEI